jgi:DNA-binding ferritin-like protein
LNLLLADLFALYIKIKNFHWHVSGPYFRDYHLLLDEQADQIYATTDPIAERVRKLGASALRSIGHIAKQSRHRKPARGLDRRGRKARLVIHLRDFSIAAHKVELRWVNSGNHQTASRN